MAQNYLSRPTLDPPETSKAVDRNVRAPTVASTRLFVGNLSPAVDEYTLIQVFSKCGKVAKMDFLFHKTGPLKGKPRGYAFVEYSTKEEAAKAVAKLHDRVLRGRKLAVSPAAAMNPEYAAGTGKPYRRGDPPKTTTLSLLKNHKKPQSAEAQIAALEAKLNAMQQSPLAVAAGSATPEPEEATGGSSKGKRRADNHEDEDPSVEDQPQRSKKTRTDESSAQKHRANLTVPPVSACLPPKPSQVTLDRAKYEDLIKKL